MNASRELRLPGSDALPRILLIGWKHFGATIFHAHCHAFIASQSVAYAGAHDEAEVRLLRAADRAPVLWLRSAQFDLTEAEATEVERVLGPLGLRIEREAPQS